MIADMLSWLRQQIETRKALAEAASSELLLSYKYGKGQGLTEDDLAHIAFNDPRQILADCEADLAVLADHDGSHECSKVEDNCMWVMDGDCPTVRRIASRYRHRPGYLPEWAPEETTP